MAEFGLGRVYDIAEELGYPCIIPLVRVMRTELKPIDVYASLRKISKLSFLLESAEIGEKIARYSFLGKSPEKLITLKEGVLNINGEEKSHVVEPMRELRKFFAGYRVYQNRLPRFHGGLLGYFSYDLIRYIEEIGNCVKDDLKHNDAEFMLVRDLIAYDHWRNEVLLISNLMLQGEGEIRRKYRTAKERIEELEKIIVNSKPLHSGRKEGKLKVKSNFDKKEFIKAVETAKEHIYAGDIFQVVLSQRFECSPKAEPFEIYLALKEVNPSPYMYFLEYQDLKIIGSSPEILVKAEEKKVTVRPIAGTRPRGMDVVEDEVLSREMLNDPKERAEHVMLVDLGRNDVGRVSRFGSVKVNEFMATEKYSHVQHIVSNVVGELREDKDAFDTMEASFPAGTVSGAPKVRAMEIIEKLEPTRRGIYAGCVGYFSFDRSMDFAITIRTIVMHGGRAYVQAGAGIVADSVPEGEYQETVNKGKAMLKAIRLAGG